MLSCCPACFWIPKRPEYVLISTGGLRSSRSIRDVAPTSKVSFRERLVSNSASETLRQRLVCRVRKIVSSDQALADRKGTRLNSSHGYISYAVFWLKKKISESTSPPRS